MKKDYYFLFIVIIVSIFVIYSLQTQRGSALLSAEIISGDEKYTEEYRAPLNSQLESFFDLDTISTNIFLQSLNPLDPEKENTIEFTAKIMNPFTESAVLEKVDIFRNSNKIVTDIENKLLGPGQEWYYTSEKIDLSGTEGGVSIIDLKATIKSNSGAIIVQEFKYSYITLKTCNSDEECKLGFVCDIENIARYSYGSESYCVKLCIDNSQCSNGQLCRAGRCSY